MDFWTRLIKSSPSKARPQSATNSPQLRLTSLKRTYNNLLQLWHNGDGVSSDPFVTENTILCLRRLSELFRDDQRGPTPHLCVSFAATSRVLVTVARIAGAFGRLNDAAKVEDIVRESLGICQALIDSEEEAFLEDRGFVDTLPDFVESVQRLSRQDGNEGLEATLVEVLFGITAKLRVESHLLRVWFRAEKPEEDDEDLTEEERRTRWEEFPLFYMLLHYVPSYGRTGEFSRMGLVYIVEMATPSSDLEKWLVEGDMAALMASGLGALYSQLSRKLAFHYRPDELPSILIFSERQAMPVAADAESTVSDSYQNHLGTFLLFLKFWQDLLEHCRSDDVKHTLLDHFQYLFLQQLLYPSLVESSDVDGGSSVAVLTYLRHILEYIDHPELVQVTLQYLFGLNTTADEPKTPTTPLSRARSRKSADLVTSFMDEDRPTPELFNLSALIFTSLSSQSQQTITATLHILSAMLRGSHHQSLTSLLRTRPVLASDQKRTIGAHEKEIEKFLSIAEDLTGFQDLESSYEQHVQDNRSNLETHPCAIQLLSLPVTNKTTILLQDEKFNFSHKILLLEDATFSSLVNLLDNFFKNDIETNLGLTQVLIDLASCGYLRLESWLLSSPSVYEYSEKHKSILEGLQLDGNAGDESILSEQQLGRLKLAKISPRVPPSSTSPILQALTRLTKQVSTYRHSITNFEALLHTTRDIIDQPSRQPTPLQTPSRSPVRGTPQAEATPITISSRIISSTSSTRNASPRGRQDTSQLSYGTPPSLVSRLGHLQLSPSRTPKSTQKSPSRSPLRAAAVNSTPAPALIPAALWRRIRVDKHTPQQKQQSHDDSSDESESDGEDDDNAITPGIDEFSPIEINPTPTKSRSHRAVPRRRAGREPAHHTPSDVSDSDDDDKELSGPRTEQKNDGTVSLGHLLSNVIILQEFALELAAITDVRGVIFGEVRFFY